MIGEMKTGLSIFNFIRNAIRNWRNIPLIEEQRRTIAHLEARVTALQQANVLLELTAMELKETIMAQKSRILDLERENMQLKDWNIEATRYELVELPPAIFVYKLKESAQNTDPPHYICAHCYNHAVKSILQRHPQARPGQSVFLCLTCKAVFNAGKPQSERR